MSHINLECLYRLRQVFYLALPFSSSAVAETSFNAAAHKNPWMFDPLALVPLVLTAWIYWQGSLRFRTRAAVIRQKNSWFWIGLAAFFTALAPPFNAMTQQLFSAHMAQLAIIMLIAAPLLVISQPFTTLLRGMALPLGRMLGRLSRDEIVRHYWKKILSPPIACLIHALALWVWHLPYFFNLSLQNSVIHATQQFCLLLGSMLLWFVLLRCRRDMARYFFASALQTCLLGSLLMFSSGVWYTPYLLSAPKWGLTALVDQQVGALFIWMPAVIALIVSGLILLARTVDIDDTKLSQPPNPGGGG